ncbi:MAG: dihydroorotate dehydrogenase electron transfer subunit [Candidatus Bathyarchaeales archaeon]
MAYRTATNKHRVTRILKIEDVSPTVKKLTFKDEICAKAMPGQFLMLWIPGVDEIPFSILDVGGHEVSIAVKRVGEATDALHKLKVNATIGIRGPFGNYFSLNHGKVLIVGGGTGIAPLLFLAKKIVGKAGKLVFITGAKTKEELLFINELEKVCGKNLIATTEDGSHGIKGLATEPLKQVLAKEKFDFIYTCGPEQMMREVFDLAEKSGIATEASLERLMRCAIGLCGSCVIGNYRVCRDGPVFSSNQLRNVKNEFGFLKRDFCGRKVPLE